ncbi:MAG: DNA translocase FtsK [Candidatus Eremiobacteraeota bacterium]|nr:DNA translocase FtsK [Candidatus Eremiobacteraeota bacterium]
MMKRTKAARSRRIDPIPGLALNLEVAGIALLCIALLLALALLLPPGKSGSLGPFAVAALRGGFGAGAWLAILALATLAIVVFLEMHAASKLALFAGCATAEFFVLDAWLGVSSRGGAIGNALAHGLIWLIGPLGSAVVLGGAAMALILVPTGLSLKKMIGGAGRHALTVSKSASVLVNALKDQRAAPPLQTSSPARRLAPETVAATNGSAPVILDPGAAVEPAADAPARRVEELERDEATRSQPEDAVPFEGAFPAEAHHAAILTPPPRDALMKMPEPKRGTGTVSYRLPDYALFNPPEKRVHNEASAALLLEETLASFGVEAKVTHIERGPSVTRYEMTPGKGVKVSAIKSLSDNIQLALAAQSIRIEAPIPGKAAVGIEVPNSAVAVVSVREILDYVPRGAGKLFFALGKDITGRPIVGDLTRMPHLLVAGATGAGKSVCLNVILTSLLSTCTPDQMQLLLIDPKRVELTSYNGIPHLIKECITDPKLAAGALYELTKEMDARYERFARAGVRKIEEYNENFPDEPLPYIVVIIDELADLMLVAPTRVETSICRIAQLARATGIHLIVATQRPSVDVITGLIKANIPSRIAFAVSSQVDSRTIIDMAGAERLLGRGDMLYLPIDSPKPVRVQGALVSGDELERLCEFWRAQDDPDNRIDFEVSEVEEDGRTPDDELAFDAARIIIERQMASVALLQAELKVGHPRAVSLMKTLEEFRVVGPAEGTKPRKILLGDGDLDALAETLAPRNREQPLF